MLSARHPDYNAGMVTTRQRPTNDLATLYARFLEQQSEEWRTQCAVVCRKRARKLGILNRQGVRSTANLLTRLPSLSPSLKLFGIGLTWLLGIRRAVPVLL